MTESFYRAPTVFVSESFYAFGGQTEHNGQECFESKCYLNFVGYLNFELESFYNEDNAHKKTEVGKTGRWENIGFENIFKQF